MPKNSWTTRPQRLSLDIARNKATLAWFWSKQRVALLFSNPCNELVPNVGVVEPPPEFKGDTSTATGSHELPLYWTARWKSQCVPSLMAECWIGHTQGCARSVWLQRYVWTYICTVRGMLHQEHHLYTWGSNLARASWLQQVVSVGERRAGWYMFTHPLHCDHGTQSFFPFHPCIYIYTNFIKSS